MLTHRVDGGWGWVVVVAALCSQILLGGVCLSGGIFYIIFMDAFQASPVTMSWLCSMPASMWFWAPPVASLLINKFDSRVCAGVGGLLAATGLILCYFSTGVISLFLSYGIITGLGFGINFTGCLTGLNMYFDKYKTLAAGLVSMGVDLGLPLYAWITPYLETSYGWRGTMLIHGACALNLCVFAAIMAPLKSKPIHQTEKDSLFRKQELQNSAKKQELPISGKKPLAFSLFRNYSFLSFCASNVLVNVSHGIFIVHIPSYSKRIGFTSVDIGILFMVWGAANILGKVFFSILGHNTRQNIVSVYSFALSTCGVCIALTTFCNSQTTLTVLYGVVGFFFCVTGSLLLPVIYSIVGYHRVADGMGLSLPFKASGNMIGGLVVGVLLSKTGNYLSSFVLAGTSMFASGILLVPAILHNRQNTTRSLVAQGLVYEADIEEAKPYRNNNHITFTSKEKESLLENGAVT